MLSNIAPPEIRRKLAAHKMWRNCFDESRNYILPIRPELENPPPHRLKSRYPIWRDDEIKGQTFDINGARERYWTSSPDISNKHRIDQPHMKLEGFTLARNEWKMLNRFRSGHDCSAMHMHRWNFQNSSFCDCGDGGLEMLHDATPEAISWLENLYINV